MGARNWCISRSKGDWDDYTQSEYNYTFYFALSKTRSYKVKDTTPLRVIYEEPLHRLALINGSPENEWDLVLDANDDEANVSALNLPKIISNPE